jgi:hypothetical protein
LAATLEKLHANWKNGDFIGGGWTSDAVPENRTNPLPWVRTSGGNGPPRAQLPVKMPA